MLRRRNRLTVFHDDNGSFSDFTEKAAEFRDQQFTVATWTEAEDYIYVGYRKAINGFYVEMETGVSVAGRLTGEYWNGTVWTSMSDFDLIDETLGLNRSGFVRWERFNDDGTNNEAQVEINSETKNFYRFRLGADTTGVVFDGVNIVFADDRDITREVFELKSCLPNGEASHILSHVSARDHIIQHLRNNGNRKLSLNTGRVADIEAFDLHDIEQINVAATYYAVSSIYFDISDQPDDVYMSKSMKYQGKFQSAMDLFYLSLDTDDDGSQDIEEELGDNTTRLFRR